MQNRAFRESGARGKLSGSSENPPRAEANLGRKASSSRRSKKPPTVVEGGVRKRRHEKVNGTPDTGSPDAGLPETKGTETCDPKSSVDREHQVANERGIDLSTLSPARVRASDQSVKRATSGLIRLESRRKLRNLMRRLLYLALLAAPIAALIYFFAEEIVDVLVAYWDRIESRLPAARAPEVPRR